MDERGRLLREAQLTEADTRPALREMGKEIASEAFRHAERHVERADQNRRLGTVCSEE
jgi:hypothetical protein